MDELEIVNVNVGAGGTGNPNIVTGNLGAGGTGNANTDAFSTDENTPITNNVLDNDGNQGSFFVTAVNGNADNLGQQITLESGALLTLNRNGELSYDPNGAFDGLDEGESATESFTYDGMIDNSPVNIDDDATVSITINGTSEPPIPTISIEDAETQEGNDSNSNLVFDVSLSQPVNEQVFVGFSTSNGTAIDEEDYLGIEEIDEGFVTFAPEQTSQTISVQIVGDTVVEADETFLVNLSNPSGAIFGEGGSTATGTIINDDFTVVNDNQAPNAFDNSYEIDSTDVASGNLITDDTGEGVDSDPDEDLLTVTGNSDPTNGSVVVNEDGTFDYTPDDSFIGTDSFTYTIDDGSEANNSFDTATVTVSVGEPEPPFDLLNLSTDIGDNGLVNLTGTVENIASSNIPITLIITWGDENGISEFEELIITDGSSDDTDGEADGSIDFSIPHTYTETGTFTIDVAADEFVNQTTFSEDSESITVDINVDPPIVPTVTIADAETDEGDEETSNLGFTVTLSEATEEEVTIDFSTEEGTAEAGVDYTEIEEGTVTFEPGEVTQTINVAIIGDTVVEEPIEETFSVNLSNAEGAVLPEGGATATGTITDNDEPEAPVITTPSATPANVTIAEADLGDVIIDLETEDNDVEGDGLTYTITGGADQDLFTVNPDTGELTFTDTPTLDDSGETEFAVQVTVTDSDNLTDEQDLTVTVESEPNVPVITNPSATPANVTIAEADLGDVIIDLETEDNDVEGDGLTYSITGGAEQDLFTVNPDTGELTFTDTPTLDDSGETEFAVQVTVTDSDNLTDEQDLTVTVEREAEAPVITTPSATPANITIAEADLGDVIIDLETEDNDVEGDGLTYTITGGADQDLFTVNPDTGELTFTETPTLDDSGETNFAVQVTVTDLDNLTDEQDLTVTVESEPNVPVITTPSATPANVTIAEADLGDVIIDLETEGNDVEGDGLTYTITGGADQDLFTVNPDTGELTFTETPTLDDSGETSFAVQVTVTDLDNLTDEQDLTVTVESDNTAPIITTSNTVEVIEGETDVININAVDDFDEEEDGLTFDITGGEDQELFAVNSNNGQLTLNEPAIFNAEGGNEFQVQVTVTDSDNLTTAQNLTVSIADANEVPIAVNDNAQTTTETGVEIDVLGNDSDPDGDELTITDNSQPENGSVTENEDGTFSYIPDEGFTGTDSFTYTISDGTEDGTDTATVTIAIEADNEVPIAVDDNAQTTTETEVEIDVLGNDSDPDGDELTITDNSQPENGSVTENEDGTFTYTPDDGFVGEDSFTYTISDDTATATATVNLTIAVEADNGVPIAVDDNAQTTTDTEVEIDVLGNDSDPDNNELIITDNSQPENGSVTENEGGTFTYTPDDDFVGEDSFTYTISDGTNTGTDTATVTIAVEAENELPAAVNDNAQTSTNTPVEIDVLGNDSDPEGDPLTITNSSQPENGTAVENEDGTFTYTPDEGFTGTDSFTYTISDDTEDETDTATVTIAVEAENELPIAVDDNAQTTAETEVEIDVLGNDSDPDGDELIVTDNSQPENGSVTENEDGTFTYTPDDDFVGEDNFTYTISDDTEDGTDTATVTIAVEADNGVPIAVDDNAQTTTETEVEIDVLGNDSDPDDDELTITNNSQPENGAAVENEDGTFTYTPDNDFVGEDSFTYTISDGNDTDTATVTIAVESLASITSNSPSIVTPATVEVAEGEINIIDIDATDDTDFEGNGLTYSLAGDNQDLLNLNPNNGLLTFNEPLIFDPEGANSFQTQIVVTDSEGLTDVQDLTISLIDEPVNPVIPNLVTQSVDTISSLEEESIIGTEGNDLLNGTINSDSLEGLEGNDIFDGGLGDDILNGGLGNDTAIYQFDEDGISIDMDANIATDGFGNSDTLISIENIVGSEFDDIITGDDRENKLTGRDGNDTIEGGDGDDFLIGLAGVDILAGDAGNDTFVYISPNEGGDIIEDFDVDNDLILIVGDTFPGELSGGLLTESLSQFSLGTEATTVNHRFIFDNNTSRLLFDRDGSGGADSQILATLTGTSELSSENIQIV